MKISFFMIFFKITKKLIYLVTEKYIYSIKDSCIEIAYKLVSDKNTFSLNKKIVEIFRGLKKLITMKTQID